MAGSVPVFGFPREIRSSWGTVFPLSLHFPWRAQDKLFYRLSGQQGPARVNSLFPPHVQAHWRGYRQKKRYLERLQYLKANVDAVIKVAGVIRTGPCLSGKIPPRTVLQSSSPTWDLGGWPNSPGSEGSASLFPRFRRGPGCGQLGGNTGGVWATSRRM